MVKKRRMSGLNRESIRDALKDAGGDCRAIFHDDDEQKRACGQGALAMLSHLEKRGGSELAGKKKRRR